MNFFLLQAPYPGRLVDLRIQIAPPPPDQVPATLASLPGDNQQVEQRDNDNRGRGRARRRRRRRQRAARPGNMFESEDDDFLEEVKETQ